MLIDAQRLTMFIERNLREIQNVNIRTHTRPCPHCGIPVRYPVIAREQDVDDFKAIIKSSCLVMEKHGITINLLAEIKAECHIEIARRKALGREYGV